jgi:ParB family chromosome partitioning protein
MTDEVGRNRLGKGLGALLGDYLEPQPAPSEIHRIPLGSIVPNPMQPRRVFTDGELDDLTTSIRENGLLQPLIVRPAPSAPDRYELVAGERRFRAVSRLEWEDVPALVREASDETLLILALVENLQREELNPLEEAEGYEALSEKFGMKHADIARAVGKDRSTVTNFLRLLKLPPSVRKLLEGRELTPGHARALLAVDDPVQAGELGRRAAKEGWSVREMERRVAHRASRAPSKRTKRKDPVVRALEEALQERLQTRVEITGARGGKGKIEIAYHDAEDFDRLFELIAGRSTTDVVQ